MNLVIAKDYKPHPAQIRFHRSGKRFLAATAGVRGGKSYAGCVEFVRRVFFDIKNGKARTVSGQGGKRRRPSLHYWIISPTAALLREPLRYLFEIIPGQLIERYYESEHALWLKNGVLLEMKTADNPLHLVASGLDGMLLDEAARIKPDAWRGQLRQRLSDRKGFAIFASTPLGRNWLYEDIVERSGVDPEYEAVHWKTRENPHIPIEEIEAARRQLPRRYFEREYEASFDSFSGTVFDEFTEQLHVISEAEFRLKYNLAHGSLNSLFRRIIAGVDWGWTSPGAIIVVGDLGGKYVVLDESYSPNRHVCDQSSGGITWVSEAHRLTAKWGVSAFYCDPAEPGNVNDFVRYSINAIKANNNINFGLRKFNEALHPIGGVPRLTILSHCKNLIREMKKYEWAPIRGTEQFKEEPLPNQSDHAIDAARYCFAELMAFDETGIKQEPGWGNKGPVF